MIGCLGIKITEAATKRVFQSTLILMENRLFLNTRKVPKKAKSREVTSSGAKKPACLPKQKILKCLTEFYDLVSTLRYAMPERLSRKQMLVLIQTRLHVYTN